MRYTENNLIAGTANRFDNYRTVVIGASPSKPSTAATNVTR